MSSNDQKKNPKNVKINSKMAATAAKPAAIAIITNTKPYGPANSSAIVVSMISLQSEGTITVEGIRININLVPCGGVEPPSPEYKTGMLAINTNRA